MADLMGSDGAGVAALGGAFTSDFPLGDDLRVDSLLVDSEGVVLFRCGKSMVHSKEIKVDVRCAFVAGQRERWG